MTADETYLTCPRCGRAVLKGGDEDGSPLCPDCREADDVLVRMDLMPVPPPNSPESTTDE